jgi:hypothetical protein
MPGAVRAAGLLVLALTAAASLVVTAASPVTRLTHHGPDAFFMRPPNVHFQTPFAEQPPLDGVAYNSIDLKSVSFVTAIRFLGSTTLKEIVFETGGTGTGHPCLFVMLFVDGISPPSGILQAS